MTRTPVRSVSGHVSAGQTDRTRGGFQAPVSGVATKIPKLTGQLGRLLELEGFGRDPSFGADEQ